MLHAANSVAFPASSPLFDPAIQLLLAESGHRPEHNLLIMHLEAEVQNKSQLQQLYDTEREDQADILTHILSFRPTIACWLLMCSDFKGK